MKKIMLTIIAVPFLIMQLSVCAAAGLAESTSTYNNFARGIYIDASSKVGRTDILSNFDPLYKKIERIEVRDNFILDVMKVKFSYFTE